MPPPPPDPDPDPEARDDAREADPKPGYRVRWTLTVEDTDATTLEAALAPDTDEHATLEASDGRLEIEGDGPPGEALHTLDDVLACLTAALDTLDTSPPATEDEG